MEVMMIDTALERAVAEQETGPGRGQDHGHVAETMIVTGEDVADTAEAEVAAGVESGPRGGRERTNTAVDEMRSVQGRVEIEEMTGTETLAALKILLCSC